jgi:hypothetical protein
MTGNRNNFTFYSFSQGLEKADHAKTSFSDCYLHSGKDFQQTKPNLGDAITPPNLTAYHHQINLKCGQLEPTFAG